MIELSQLPLNILEQLEQSATKLNFATEPSRAIRTATRLNFATVITGQPHGHSKFWTARWPEKNLRLGYSPSVYKLVVLHSLCN